MGVVRAVASLVLLLAPATAGATPLTLAIDWVATTSTNPVSLASLDTAHYLGRPGDVVTAELVFSIDPGVPISTYAASVRFDAEGGDQLDVAAVTSPTWIPLAPGLFWPIHVIPGPEESSPGVAGLVTSFSHQTFANLPVGPFTVSVGSIEFVLTDALLATGTVVEPGYFKFGRDGWIDADRVYRTDGLTAVPGSVRAIPEPGTLALLATGLASCALLRRRHGRSTARLGSLVGTRARG